MKQFITRKIILLAVMLLTSVGSSFAFEYGGLTYRVIDNDAKTVKVTYQGSDAYSNPYTKSSIVIPETVDFNGNTYTVVEIGDNAFQNAALSSITIPATVKTIGGSAFMNCQNLVSIDLSGIETFGTYIFNMCTSLTTVKLPETLQSIPDGMFSMCSSITNFSFDNITSIGFSAFSDTGFTSVTLSCNSIGMNAFANCKKLTKITLLGSFYNMVDNQFFGCDNVMTFICFRNTGNYGFSDDVKEKATVIVPESQVSNWKNSGFLNVKAADITNVGGHVVEVGPTGASMSIFINGKASDLMYGEAFIVEPGTDVEVKFGFYDPVAELASFTINGTDYTSSVVDNKYTIKNISGNQLIKATWREGASYNLSTWFDTMNGNVLVNGNQVYGGSQKYPANKNITMLIKPNEGYGISSFSINTGEDKIKQLTDNGDGTFSYTFNLQAETNVNIGFDKIFELTVTYNDGGTVMIDDGIITSGTAIELMGAMANVIIQPNENYDLASVLYNGTDVTTTWVMSMGTMSNIYYIYPSSDQGDNQTLVVTFKKIQEEINNIYYKFFEADGVYQATVTGNNEISGDVVIPETVEIDGMKYTVTSIGNDAFSNCSNLISVKMGENVSSIGFQAFQNCSSLTSIILPDKLESIGSKAFQSNRALTSIKIPGSVKVIDDYAFEGCSFTSITIPNSVTTIGGGAFQDNVNLTTAILGDGITEIKYSTFQSCYNLTSITIPDRVTSIGERAFNGCNKLTSVKLPTSLTSMGEYVFDMCSLNSIELPNSFTVIPDNLFANVYNLQYIKLGNNVKSIGKSAFSSTDPVIEIGTSTPPTIDKDAFPNVVYLADLTVIVPDATAEAAYRKAAVWQEMTFSNLNNISEVTVDTPGDIGFELLTECDMQPAKVVGLKVNGTINADDFAQMLVNMKSLLRLDLSGCNITEIPDEALKGKTQLQELTLPSILQTIGRSAFQGCNYLTGELNLPSTVTTIGEYAFEGTNYTSVKLSSALKTIGDYAFYNVPVKQKLILPDAMTSIGDYAFADTYISGPVEIPEGIKYLGAGAFKNTQIDYISLPDNPNGITSISRELFQGCSNLDYIDIPRNFTEVSGYAFDGCSNLSYVRLSPNLVTMGEYAFQSTQLEYIKVPSKVEVLSHGVLKNCSSLVSLSLPANLKTVEDEALIGCTALRNLSVEAVEPPAISNRSAIRGINTDLCLISIPTESYRKYVLAEYWGQFVQMRNDIAVETDGDGEIAFESVDEEEDEVAEARTRGQRFAATRGGTRASTAEDESLTIANNGSSIYIPKQGKVRFHIIPGEGEELLSATLDGEDIKSFIKDGVYTATADKKSAKLVVKFSGSKLEGDANGDDKVNVVDIVHLVNAKASQAEIDKVVKILMGK